MIARNAHDPTTRGRSVYYSLATWLTWRLPSCTRAYRPGGRQRRCSRSRSRAANGPRCTTGRLVLSTLLLMSFTPPSNPGSVKISDEKTVVQTCPLAHEGEIATRRHPKYYCAESCVPALPEHLIHTPIYPPPSPSIIHPSAYTLSILIAHTRTSTCTPATSDLLPSVAEANCLPRSCTTFRQKKFCPKSEPPSASLSIIIIIIIIIIIKIVVTASICVYLPRLLHPLSLHFRSRPLPPPLCNLCSRCIERPTDRQNHRSTYSIIQTPHTLRTRYITHLSYIGTVF